MKTGQNLRALRKRRGLTLDELSALCGVSRDDLGRYERGQMTPRPGTAAKIARALDAPIVDIQQGMGWTASQPEERWETGEAPLREGILETLRESADFVPSEADVRLLMESVKAAIPALVEHMKDTRPEEEIHRRILAELGLPAAEENPVSRYALTDEQWAQVSPLLPPEKTGRGRSFKSNRLMLDGILCHLRSGAAWKDLPEAFGRCKCVSDRLRLWQATGVWDAVRRKLEALGVLDKEPSQTE